MVTDFEERLRQIREAKHRESEQLKRDDVAHAGERHAELASRFDRREKVEKSLEHCAEKFIGLVPSFSKHKSFFEGMYKIEVHSDDLVVGDGGKVSKQFSRVTFLIDVQSPDGRIGVRCKKTVRNRDLESASFLIERGSEALEAFASFAEEQFIEFAGEYFSGAPAAHR